MSGCKFTVCFPLILGASLLSFTLSLCYCSIVSTLFQLLAFDGCKNPRHCSDATQRCTNNPTILSTFIFLIFLEVMEAVKRLAELASDAERGKFEKLLFPLHRGSGGGGCGGWRYCSRWNNGSCGATCSGAHMNGRGSGMCVGHWPGVSVPKPLSQRLTMKAHKVGIS